MKNTPSEKYRLMIYFAHSTLVMYQKTIIISNEEVSVEDFRKDNMEVIQRVFDEGVSIFNYELSYEQMSRAIYCYIKSINSPLSVKEVPVFTLK